MQLGRKWCGIPLALWIFAVAQTQVQAVTFSDGDFSPMDWTRSTVSFGNGGTIFETQQPAGGNPSGYLQTQLNVANAPGGGTFSRILGIYLEDAAIYDPQTQGSIDHINYREDAILLSGFGNGQGIHAALGQAGKLYLGPLLLSPDFFWVSKVQNGLTESSFFEAHDNFASHPDFSATGNPITFGFARRNTTFGAGFTILGGIDNWQVEVVSQVPEPATLWLLIAGILTIYSRQRPKVS
jgi:hypothetical protein